LPALPAAALRLPGRRPYWVSEPDVHGRSTPACGRSPHVLGTHPFAQIVRTAREVYGQLRIRSYRAILNGDSAGATYRCTVHGLDQVREPWSAELRAGPTTSAEASLTSLDADRRRKDTASPVVGTRAHNVGPCQRGDHGGCWAPASALWSGREDLNLDSFPGREACCNYTTSAKPASDEPDTFVVSTTFRTIREPGCDSRTSELRAT
jgi:hypothetical protein